ncbi:hypothetical protein GB937_008113 [Aspergillus fischeri]|nr:hypothetical protein GB937_008113 [Aspergillus fischeri]
MIYPMARQASLSSTSTPVSPSQISTGMSGTASNSDLLFEYAYLVTLGVDVTANHDLVVLYAVTLTSDGGIANDDRDWGDQVPSGTAYVMPSA